jgi:hypothetical protein
MEPAEPQFLQFSRDIYIPRNSPVPTQKENRTIPIEKLREPWKSFLCLPLYGAEVEEGGKNGIQVEGGTGWAGG